MPLQFFWSAHFESTSAFSDGVQLALQGQPVERTDRKHYEEADPSIELRVDTSEQCQLFFLWPLECGRIFDAPVRCHQLARPYRTGLPGRGITNREDKIKC